MMREERDSMLGTGQLKLGTPSTITGRALCLLLYKIALSASTEHFFKLLTYDALISSDAHDINNGLHGAGRLKGPRSLPAIEFTLEASNNNT
jgi:hypothetical protein